MKQRVHEIAKERGLSSKDVIERLRDAGVEVKAASSNVDSDVARRVLSGGDGASAPDAAEAPEPQAPAPQRQADTAGRRGPRPRGTAGLRAARPRRVRPSTSAPPATRSRASARRAPRVAAAAS